MARRLRFHLLRARLLGSLTLALSAALGASAGLSPSAHAAAAPPGMFNAGDWAWPTAATLDREGAAGVRSWRVVLDFSVIGRTAGTYDWPGIDGLVRDMDARGITPLFVMKGCPSRDCGTGTLPTSGQALTDWNAFVAAAAKRYGSAGTFWAANPTIAKRPIIYWQIMNEVNGAEEWPNPSAAAYSSFLVSTSQTLKAADPSAKVVLAGLPEIMTIWMKDYLPALYKQPGFKSAVDVIAVHGYAANPSATAKVLDTARTIMLQNDDAAKPLWVTEFAWATSGQAGDPFVVDEATQAADLRGTGDLMVGCAARWNLQRAYWFGWKDATVDGSGYWGYHVGLNRYDGTAKPALTALDELTSGATLPNNRGASCPLPGGTYLDITIPDTTITSGPGVATNDPRPAYAFGASESPVTYQCSMDGNAWATCTPDPTTGVWRPATALSDGQHTLRVRAVDPYGNVDATPAQNTTVYDKYPADTYISGTWGNVTTHTVSLTLSASEVLLRYECQIDAGAWATCTSPFSAYLANGSHTINVRAVDLAGNLDPQPAQAWYSVKAG